MELHSEIGQTFKTELSLGSSQRLKSVNHFRKKLPPLTGLWGLTGLWVWKIDDIDKKDTWKLI